MQSNNNELYLSDLLDRLLDTGVVLRGHITISVADIDLIYLDVSVVLASVERALKWERISLEESRGNSRSIKH